MSLNFKLKIISFFIIIAFPVGGLWYYRYTHPKYIPLPPRKEINITIIPGWNLRQIADDWNKKGIIKTNDELFELLGQPAYNYKAVGKMAPDLNLVSVSGTPSLYPLLLEKPMGVSYEGFLFPDTYRVYANAEPVEVLRKIFDNLEEKITLEMREEIKKQGKSFYEILTMASVVQKEAPAGEMGMVADIFWRRNQNNWAMQSCATVNYITGKNDPGVTDKDRSIDSLFNTYKYPGLPLGAISNPSLEAIKAAIYPTKNNYWYFMAGTDGVTHYARTLDEHNINVAKYLR
ncbi:MAG: endolytic transglycosylase MltG [Candidatus Magasanikbacteria bacterium]